MKTIKFRAWDNKRNKMYDINNINFKKGLINVFEADDIGSYCSGNVERPFALIDIMQFTGLQDKNGKDIYEGDIIRIHEGSEDFKETLIEWDENLMGFKPTNKELRFTLESAYSEFYEIIGNNHEN